MKKIFFAAMILCSFKLSAQKLYFPSSNYTDSIKLDNAIHTLAKSLYSNYKNDDRIAYLKDQYLIAIAAGEYAAVQPIIAELSKIQYNDPTVTGAQAFPERIYTAVMAMNPPTDAAFNGEYTKLFSDRYDAFNDDNKNWAAEYFGRGLMRRNEEAYQRLIADLKSADSISMGNAVTLTTKYTLRKIYGRTTSLAKAILLVKEDERYIVTDSVDVKLPGGATVTAVIVQSKKDPSPHPVALSYNIYAGNDVFIAKDAVFHGYTGVVVNIRGKRTSNDPIVPFEYDGDDAYFILDWISKQSWCNGKIGMYGGSYLGFAQWATMKKVHPALKTIVPQVSVGAGIDYPYFNGVFMTYALRWLHFVMNNKTTDNTVFSDEAKWNNVS